ncbi:MAG: DUF4268 domain-containing protein [Chloroflexi bacterium]|nr:DUF4268 domain-containing protein [Chloroflexota bacterium]
MSKSDLGTIEKVNLQDVWPNEAQDFTPWLEQNLLALGDSLGMELEMEKREAPVGSFSLDLLANDLSRGRTVVIENQLTQTDHKHLGQLLMYASGYDASVVVWLAKEIREEHRQAIDWLNQRTDERTEFFGVAIELLKIDNSRPAPHFKLVAFPNDFRKHNVGIGEAAIPSERQELYRTYFQNLFDRLRESHKFTGARKAQSKSFTGLSSGFSRISYAHSFAQGGRVRLGLYIDQREASENKWLFDQLEKDKASLESEFGEPFEWDRLDLKKASQIVIYRDGTIDEDLETLEDISNWAIDGLLKLKSVFRPRLAKILENRGQENATK